MIGAETIIDALGTLSLAELRRIDTALHDLLERYEEWQQPDYNSQEPRVVTGKTYRQEMVRCGKPTCTKCEQGPGHGPYWYAYWSENGRTRKQYIGKQFREV